LFDAALESATFIMQPPKRKAVLVKLSGERTETLLLEKRGVSVLFYGQNKSKKGGF
jgi:hypothetical protein